MLPIAIAGTREMRPKGSKWFGKAHACAKILDPIPTTGMTAADVANLRDRTRDTISGALPELRARYGYTKQELADVVKAAHKKSNGVTTHDESATA